jgi:hypothetical protein
MIQVNSINLLEKFELFDKARQSTNNHFSKSCFDSILNFIYHLINFRIKLK